jgi:exodeoxyribonuclease VIII
MEEEMRTDLDNQSYHAHPAISSSDVKAVYKTSLAHWKGKARKPSSAFAMGSAVHALVLEPEKNLVLRGPEDRRGNKWKEAQLAADLDGQILLPEGDFDLAARIADAVKAHPVAAMYLADPTFVAEASFFGIDPVTGIEIKCRPDGYLPEAGLVFDVKTTTDASPDGFPRELRKYAYDVQAAFYLRALRSAGYKADAFIFIAVEKEPPHAVGLHALTVRYLDQADIVVTQTLQKISNAIAVSDFTTGWPLINTIDLPRWQTETTEDDVFTETVDF